VLAGQSSTGVDDVAPPVIAAALHRDFGAGDPIEDDDVLDRLRPFERSSQIFLRWRTEPRR